VSGLHGAGRSRDGVAWERAWSSASWWNRRNKMLVFSVTTTVSADEGKRCKEDGVSWMAPPHPRAAARRAVHLAPSGLGDSPTQG